MPKFFLSPGNTGAATKQFLEDVARDKMNLYRSTLNFSLGSITDRSQIINPTDYVDISQYTNDAAGRSLYESDLSAAQNLAKQQEAAYLDWFNSSAQQVERDLEAGLNPALNGLNSTSGTQTDSPSGSPLDNVMSDEQIRAQKIQNAMSVMSGITSLVGTIANVAQLPSVFKQMKLTDAQIGLVQEQADAVKLGNFANFESLVSNEIASRLSDAAASAIQSGKSLNIAEWFGNDENFVNLDSYAPSNSFMYQDSLSNVRKRMQKSLGAAYKDGAITAENQKSWSSLVADPRYSADQLVQIGAMRPLMAANAKMELARLQLEETMNSWNQKYYTAKDALAAANAENAKNKYDNEYWTKLDGERVAAFEEYVRTCQEVSQTLDMKINSNWLEVYTQHSDNDKGLGIAYLFKSGASASLSDYFYSNNMSELKKVIDNHNIILGAQADNADLRESIGAVAPLLPYIRSVGRFGPISWNQPSNIFEMNAYKLLLKELADSF